MVDFGLELPDPNQQKIDAQRQALGILTRRIREGDPPPDVTAAIDDVLDGRIPRW